MRLGSAVLAAFALWAAANATWIRDAEAFLTGRVAVPAALAVAILLVGFGAFTAAGRTTRWLALAVLAQAASLQLMRAGPAVGYQHYLPAVELVSPDGLPWLIVLGAQAVAVAAGLTREWSRVRAWLAAQGALRVLSIGAVVVLTGAALSRDPSVYVVELALAGTIQLLALATVALAVLALPAGALDALGDRLDAVLGKASADGAAEPGGVDRFALLCGVWVVLAAALLAWVAYERHPHVPDEVVYLYHARYFARGLLWMAPPPVPDAFNLDLMTYEPGRWYSPVPPGWPAILAIGAFFGATWLVNPILAGANILLAYVLVRELYDRRTARLAILLLSASPWLLFMGMNFMTHTLTLTAALVAAVCVARMRRTGRIAWAVPGGLATGFLALLRPLEALIIAVLLGAWSLFNGGRLRPARTAVLAAAAVLGAAITFPYNRAFTGRATYFPLIAYTDAQYGAGSNALGFGAERGLGWPGLDPFPGHGAADVVVNAILNAYQVSTELFGWGVGSLLLIAFFLSTRPRAWRRADAWMAAAIIAVIGAHTFYWFSGGPDFGARYWFLIVVPCVVLTVRGVQRMGDVGRPAEVRAIAAVLGLTLAALAVFVPWRAADKYHHYRFMRPDVRALAAAHGFDGALVLVQGRRHPDYASAAAYNPVDLRADATVYAWDRGPEVRRDVLSAYEDRQVWIVEGPTVTGAGYRVARGPVPATLLLSELDAEGGAGTRPGTASAQAPR